MTPPDFAFLFRSKETSNLPKLSTEEFAIRRKIIEKAVIQCLDNQIVAGLLFGSFVHGAINEKSDVDIFTVTTTGMSPKVITSFKERLQNKLGTLKLHIDTISGDVTDLHALSQILHQPPFSDGFEIITSDEEVRRKIIKAVETF